MKNPQVKGPAQPPKGFKPNDNGIECICWNIPTAGVCRACFHKERPETLDEYKDSNGDQIKSGDKLRYVNPSFPDREQPIHEFFWNEEKKHGEYIVNGARHRCRKGGMFNKQRFTIIK